MQRLLLSSLTIWLLALNPHNARASDAASDTAEAAFERYRATINLHDFNRLALDVIAPDARFSFGEETHEGIEAVRLSFNRSWSVLPDEVYTMTPLRWVRLDDRSALVFFRYAYRGTTSDGRRLSGGGAGINLFRQSAAGWRLFEEHLSADPTPPAVTQTITLDQ